MECLLGIKGPDFVVLASDMTCANSIMVMKNDEDKLHKLANNLVMAVSGEAGDTTQFAEYIGKNIQLYKMRNAYELGPQAAAFFTRRNLAEALRTRNAYQVNLLLGGYDKNTGPELYFIDYLASMISAKYAAHCYGGYLSLSVMDRYYNDNLTRQEAYNLLKMCIEEVQKRFIVNLPNFRVKLIDANGITDLETVTPQNVHTVVG